MKRVKMMTVGVPIARKVKTTFPKLTMEARQLVIYKHQNSHFNSGRTWLEKSTIKASFSQEKKDDLTKAQLLQPSLNKSKRTTMK